jgi:hypothetical protein
VIAGVAMVVSGLEVLDAVEQHLLVLKHGVCWRAATGHEAMVAAGRSVQKALRGSAGCLLCSHSK